MVVMKRRTFLSAAVALPLASLACGKKKAPEIPCAFAGPSLELGHALREGVLPPPDSYESVPVLIVGAGIAGLSAAWRMEGAGFRDYVLLEMENEVGGTSRSGANAISPFPWGAHYVPAPTREVKALVRLLDEAGVMEGYDAKGEPIFAEQHLIHAPEERIFEKGQWWEGLYLHLGESPEEKRQYKTFFDEVDRWTRWRDRQGRRAFTLPRFRGSDAPEVRALDRLSFAQWLDERGLTSERLRWFLDYACRDDFGGRLETVSAWAGLFYYASRKEGPGEESRPLLTWPEGNGFLVNHLKGCCADRVRTGMAATRISPVEGGIEVAAWDARQGRAVGWRARKVVFAGPVAMAGRLIPQLAQARGKTHFQAFQASPWMVANLTLKARPRETGFPVAWDNVIRDSSGLGYVVATHQTPHDRGPTVWTYYHPFTGESIRSEWIRMLTLDPAACRDLILGDLRRVHPDIDACVTRIDIMRWAHAMVRPRVGLLWGPELELARQPFMGIHFAHSDLSGFALFEEAQDHGLRAAEEVLGALGLSGNSWRS